MAQVLSLIYIIGINGSLDCSWCNIDAITHNLDFKAGTSPCLSYGDLIEHCTICGGPDPNQLIWNPNVRNAQRESSWRIYMGSNFVKYCQILSNIVKSPIPSQIVPRLIPIVLGDVLYVTLDSCYSLFISTVWKSSCAISYGSASCQFEMNDGILQYNEDNYMKIIVISVERGMGAGVQDVDWM